jgi:hypothetical protein
MGRQPNNNKEPIIGRNPLAIPSYDNRPQSLPPAPACHTPWRRYRCPWAPGVARLLVGLLGPWQRRYRRERFGAGRISSQSFQDPSCGAGHMYIHAQTNIISMSCMARAEAFRRNKPLGLNMIYSTSSTYMFGSSCNKSFGCRGIRRTHRWPNRYRDTLLFSCVFWYQIAR